MTSLIGMAASTSLDLPEGPELTPDSSSDEVFSNIVTLPRFSLYDSIVHDLVGPQKLKFGMDKGLLCYHSPFFKEAFTSPYKEAFDGILVLEDESHRVFSLFNHWAYDPTILRYPKPLTLIDLYAFAEERVVKRLQNDVVDICIWHAIYNDSIWTRNRSTLRGDRL